MDAFYCELKQKGGYTLDFNNFVKNLEDDYVSSYCISENSALDAMKKFYSYYKINPKKFERQSDALREERLLTLGMRQITEEFVEAIKRGQMEIVFDQGSPEIIHNLDYPIESREDNDPLKKIIYRRPSGATALAMSKLGDDAGAHEKIYAVMAQLSGMSPSLLKMVETTDKRLVECLGNFFLQI